MQVGTDVTDSITDSKQAAAKLACLNHPYYVLSALNLAHNHAAGQSRSSAAHLDQFPVRGPEGNWLCCTMRAEASRALWIYLDFAAMEPHVM